ncbi:DUF3231 family protein [Metabacillus rhizolycopersici]|uniref:DUF3231 family protein n=1 Tax=Metabacillus rhizolycopersici TaxID=2875709 RepID=A0ABS7UZQ8_9BACI|nr:DUF3231 family protein [Metabacillus rhizolycopersici]MBZ5753815.1 DUF3231 family protein [Metabacillus rhizolycopersici]
MQKQETLLSTWLGDRRPLDASELGEIFYTIERNYGSGAKIAFF